jgi:hypothetical protein
MDRSITLKGWTTKPSNRVAGYQLVQRQEGTLFCLHQHRFQPRIPQVNVDVWGTRRFFRTASQMTQDAQQVIGTFQIQFVGSKREKNSFSEMSARLHQDHFFCRISYDDNDSRDSAQAISGWSLSRSTTTIRYCLATRLVS